MCTSLVAEGTVKPGESKGTVNKGPCVEVYMYVRMYACMTSYMCVSVCFSRLQSFSFCNLGDGLKRDGLWPQLFLQV